MAHCFFLLRRWGLSPDRGIRIVILLRFSWIGVYCFDLCNDTYFFFFLEWLHVPFLQGIWNDEGQGAHGVGRGTLEEGYKVMVRWFLTFEARDLYSCDWSYPVAIQINIAGVKWQIAILCSTKLGNFSSLTKYCVDDNDTIYHGCLAHRGSLDYFPSFYILCPKNHTGLIQMPGWDIISPDEKPWNARSWTRVGPGQVYQLVKLIKLVRALSQ